MANTTFVPQTTRISSTWLNDINNFKYVLFNGAESSTEAREAINAVNKAGDTLDGFLTLHADPSSDMHAATKQYVDANAGGVPSEIGNPVYLYGNIGGLGDPIRIFFLNSSNDDGYVLECSLGAGQFRLATVTAGEVVDNKFVFDMTNSIGTASGSANADWAVTPS